MMFGKLRLKALTTAAALLFCIASTGVGTRSAIIFYEPDIPESLQRR